ncbi:hypothetical protein [Croceicoccus naphthovorans]|uniref:hypothetical protein n=1 Tax=Croceicoccus naphthovorans TaxID=1348774 RepID=UPI000A9A739C|nr:hypothetical protein [Croceicoccus naphthovorans]MBB3990185.1 hypothetical protein [Croceicoccus naphthovorans]
MIEARVTGTGFAARMAAAIDRKLSIRRRRTRVDADPSANWRRADWLWPDFAPRFKD